MRGASRNRGCGATSIISLLLVLLALVGCRSAPSLQYLSLRANGDPNLDQFGRFVGQWYIEQEVLQPDGSWQAVEPAEWRFHYAIGGYAIQDQWIQPPSSQTLMPGETRQYGTNLRIYDPESDSWQITWAASDSPSFTTYTANANERGEIVMSGPDPDRPGVTQRITYFDIMDDQWSWRLEFSRDDENWLEVARISAARMR